MSDPLIEPSDLGLYLNDPSINEDRATMMIDLAQTACESILNPLPATARPILMRIAARGYTTTTARSAQLAASGSPMGGTPPGASGVYVTTKDEYDLAKLAASASGVSAFTIHTSGPAPGAWDSNQGASVFPVMGEAEVYQWGRYW